MADIINFPHQFAEPEPLEIQITAKLFPEGYSSLEIDGSDLSERDERYTLAQFLYSLADDLMREGE